MDPKMFVRMLELRTTTFLALLAAGTAVSLAGCGDRSVAPKALVPLTLKTQGTGVTAVRALPPLTSATLAGVAAQDVEVTFSRALLVIRDVRFKLDDGIADGDSIEDELVSGFEGADGDSVEEDDADDEDGGMAVFRGPWVLDLVSQQSAALDTVLVPPGDYRRVQGHLRALHEGDPGAAGDLSFLVGSTVFLEGTISGEGGGPFTYQVRIDDEFQIRGRFTVETATPATGFITFDLSRWLVDREGRFLDPRLAENDQAIRSAIRHSIKVWMDDDHDGQLDDAERDRGD